MIPRLHLITDDGILGGDLFLPRAEALLEMGGPALAFHLRGPRTPGGTLHALGAALAPVARRRGSLFLVNDRVDVALALGVRAMHLGQRSLPAGVARSLLGPGGLLGLSVHGPGEMPESGSDGPDFLMVGTLFATPTHPEREGAGTGRVGEIQALSRLPLVGIGGITPERVSDVLGAGAHGVAVRGGIWAAPDPVEGLMGYLEALAAATSPPRHREDGTEREAS